MEALIRDTSADPVVWNEDVENSMRLQYANELFGRGMNSAGISQMMMAVSAKPTQAALSMWASVMRQVGLNSEAVEAMYSQLYEPPVFTNDVVAIYTGASGFFTGADIGASCS